MLKFLITCLTTCVIISNLHGIEKLNHTKRTMLILKKTIPGWCSDEKASTMFDLVLEQKPEVCVEIGAFGGSSILPTAMALKENQKGIVYAIDAWDTQVSIQNTLDSVHQKYWNSIDFQRIYNGFLQMLSQHGLTSYCKALKMTSEKALDCISSKIDILHIDGDHSEIASFSDAILYFPRVKIGGYIIFDDVSWPTTKKAVDFLKKYCEELKSVDKGNCIFLKKMQEAASS